MEFRSQKATRSLIALSLLLLPASLFGQEFRYEVWRGHPPHLKKERGTLIITGSGVSFEESYAGKKQKPKHPHVWNWSYEDIQQLEVAPRTISVLTYKDNKWKFGADREYHFDLRGDGSFRDSYGFLKDKLDQRFVAELADKDIKAIWEIPVKHLLRFGGSEGVLGFGEDRVVYTTDRKNQSRTWRYADIDNISTSGPFQLTITTYERALSHYGNLKGFNFQLKQRLNEDRYNEVWQKINQAKGLKILQAYTERTTGQ
jgi:hypothetical protein